MGKLLREKISELGEPDVISLLAEIQDARGIRLPDEDGRSVMDMLVFYFYPVGSDRRVPIRREEVLPGGLLDTVVGKFAGTGVYRLCDELARVEGGSAEAHLTSKVYVVLNRLVPVYGGAKGKRSSVAGRRMFDVVRGFSA